MRIAHYASVMVLISGLGFISGTQASGQIGLTNDPTISSAPDSPLAGVLSFGSSVPTTLKFRVETAGEAWTVQSHDLASDHQIPLLGLAPDRQYSVSQLVLTDASGSTLSLDDSLNITTPPLPADFPRIEVKQSARNRMEQGYTMVPVRRRRGSNGSVYTMAVDHAGEVRWYIPHSADDIRRQPDGTFFSRFRENRNVVIFDALGNIINSWHGDSSTAVPPGSTHVVTEDIHHEAFPMPNGNILTLTRTTRTVNDFPTSETDSSAPRMTAEVEDNPVIEFAPDGTIVNQWSLLDMLDPTRIGYDTLRPNGSRHDWAHANAVIYDATDDSVIVSVRHQDAVVKFSRSSGELQWILGNHEDWSADLQPYLLDPVGANLEWAYHTHSPMILPNGNLLLHDNGNHRASPPDTPLPADENYTRAVEFAIDENTMQVEQVWEYGPDADEVIFSPTRGDADWLEATDNVLVTFSHVTHVDGMETDFSRPRIVEVDRAGNRVFDLEISHDGEGAFVYRSERIASLYPPNYTVRLVPEPAMGGWLGAALAAVYLIARRRQQ